MQLHDGIAERPERQQLSFKDKERKKIILDTKRENPLFRQLNGGPGPPGRGSCQGPGLLTRRLASRLKLDGMLTEGYDQTNFMDLIQEYLCHIVFKPEPVGICWPRPGRALMMA